MYPDGFHAVDMNRSPAWDRKAKHATRTERPVRYYMIDFGLAVLLLEGETRLVYPVHGGDRSAPEHRPELVDALVPHDPFATDVYYLGNLIREEFVEVRHFQVFWDSFS